MPFSHSFSGRAVAAELSLAAQRREYCEGHRRRRAAAAELMAEPPPPAVPAPDELRILCGVASSCCWLVNRSFALLYTTSSCRQSLFRMHYT